MDNKILDDLEDKNSNNLNNKENVFYYNTTETLNNQTYDNQYLQTEKNYLNENDQLKNFQTLRKENMSGNKNPNKLLLQNLTIESESIYIFILLVFHFYLLIKTIIRFINTYFIFYIS